MCSNEVTLGGLPGGFRSGTGHQENQALIRSLDLQPHPVVRAGGGAAVVTSHESVMVTKPPWKSLEHCVQGAGRWVSASTCREVAAPQSSGQKLLCSGPPDLALCPFLGCLSVSFTINQ